MMAVKECINTFMAREQECLDIVKNSPEEGKNIDDQWVKRMFNPAVSRCWKTNWNISNPGQS